MFIVTLKQKPILLTVNERYLIEKNLNGDVMEKLDLKSLEKLQQLDNTDNALENPTVPIVKLLFDYIRKDRRERIYTMEDDENAEVCGMHLINWTFLSHYTLEFVSYSCMWSL